MPFTLISFPFDQATPDILDPGGQGVLIHAIPAGSYVECHVLYSLAPDQEAQTDVVLSPDGSAFDGYLYRRGPGSDNAGSGNVAVEPAALNFSNIVSTLSNQTTALALLNTTVYLALYSRTTPPSVFTGVCVLKIYS